VQLAVADLGLAGVDAAGLDPDQDLAAARLGNRDVADVEHSHRAVFVEPYRLHRRLRVVASTAVPCRCH
jgi:hypothetical protein